MYLLLDIGGTKTRIAVARDFKNILRSKIVATPSSYEEGLNLICELAKELLGAGKLSGVAVGLATPLDDEKSGVLYHSGKKVFFDWVEKPFKSDLENRLKSSVFLENDALMGAMGEATFGPGRGHEIVAFLTISTGIGGALIINGKPAPSARNLEPAWMVIDQKKGKFIELKNYGGGHIKKLSGRSPKEIADRKFWLEYTGQLAIGIHNIELMWSPHVIVLGGSMVKKIKISELRLELKKIPTPFKDRPKIIKSKLGDLNGIYGAMAYLAMKNKKV